MGRVLTAFCINKSKLTFNIKRFMYKNKSFAQYMKLQHHENKCIYAPYAHFENLFLSSVTVHETKK